VLTLVITALLIRKPFATISLSWFVNKQFWLGPCPYSGGEIRDHDQSWGFQPMPLLLAFQGTGNPIPHSGRLKTILYSLVLKKDYTPIVADSVYYFIRLTASEDKPMDGNERSEKIIVILEANFKSPK
jgi:hypothetical protein